MTWDEYKWYIVNSY